MEHQPHLGVQRGGWQGWEEVREVEDGGGCPPVMEISSVQGEQVDFVLHRDAVIF